MTALDKSSLGNLFVHAASQAAMSWECISLVFNVNE